MVIAMDVRKTRLMREAGGQAYTKPFLKDDKVSEVTGWLGKGKSGFWPATA
jgi:hypothetical protein